MAELETQSFHDQLVAALESEDESLLAEVLRDAHAADIAETFNVLRDEDRSRIFFALPARTAAEMMVHLDERVRGDVVEDLDTRSLTELVASLAPDDAADVLGELDREEAGEILQQLEASQSEKIGELLEFDEWSAGGIMTPDVVALPATATVADAEEQVRRAAHVDDLHEIYIVDEERRPMGTVPLRRLVTSDPETRLQDILDDDIVTVRTTDDQESVVQIIRKYDVAEAVVVDQEGRLVGRITHDDLLDVAEEEAAEDLYRMAGTDAAELESGSVFHAARVRLTWLLPCMLGTMLTAAVLHMGEAQFDSVLFGALVAFAPMMGAISGNSGIQISTIIIRGFATGEMASINLSRALFREGRIALAMAPVCGITAWLLATLGLPLMRLIGGGSGDLPNPERVGMAIGLAMTSAILVSGMLGIILPYSFRKLGIDPAIASGPLVTTTNDAISISIYMLLAMAIAR